LEWDYRVKDLLLTKVSDNSLDLIYGFDYCLSNSSPSASKLIKSNFKKKSKSENGRMFKRARIAEINPEHGEIVDFSGYWIDP
jgi:hypothetical protein